MPDQLTPDLDSPGDEDRANDRSAKCTPNIVEQDETTCKEDLYVDLGARMPTDSSIIQADIPAEVDFGAESDLISGYDFLGDEKEVYASEWSTSITEAT